MHLGTMTWTMGPRHGATTENAIRYIDFAADNNLQGVLFEGWNEGWETWGGKQHFDYAKAYADFDIDSIAAYAKSKGIELWAHNETGGNIPEYEAALDLREVSIITRSMACATIRRWSRRQRNIS